MEESEAIQLFEEFFSSAYAVEAKDLAKEYPDKKSLVVDWSRLYAYHSDLGEAVLEAPERLRGWAEYVLQNMPLAALGEFKPRVRFFNIPEERNVLVQNLSAQHLGKLIRVEGVVSLITDIKPRIKRATWQCVACEAEQQTMPEQHEIKPPASCPACGRKGKELFRMMPKKSQYEDVQNGKIQELVERVRGSSPASQIDLWMEDDLVNRITPGEKVIVTGILRTKQLSDRKGKTSVYAKFMDVSSVKRMDTEFEEVVITPEEEEQILKLSRDPKLSEKIIDSVAKGIYGHKEAKEAIALQLFGGTRDKMLPDGQKIRSDIHVLLIGDPGTGKSQMLQYVFRLAPKCIYVAGAGSSGVGLTASAEHDELGEGWVLKAGALVLASGGVVALDEFEKMRDEDRGAIHEALEQQFVSIAKAGIVTRFKSQTSVLAAANPKFGRFDPNQPIASQFVLEPSLLSRFDLIFPIKDVMDSAKDTALAEHILKGHKSTMLDEGVEFDEEILPTVTVNLLRKYIAYARRNIRPKLSEAAGEKIKEFYVELRRIGEREKTFPITARQIEGLIRLAEASAKMRLSKEVEVQDAERAIKLLDYVLNQVFVDRETGKIDYDVVATGQSKSKTDKQRTIVQLISAAEAQTDMVAIDDIVKQAEGYGIEEFSARKIIEEMLRVGDLYQVRPGFVKNTQRKNW